MSYYISIFVWLLLHVLGLVGQPVDSRVLQRRSDSVHNITMCWWLEPRVGVIRDALYLDGGYIGYLPAYENGTVGVPVQPEDGSVMYSLNFTLPYSTSTNATNLFTTIPKVAGADNNQAPNYYDGMMFANDDELYLYGGVIRDTESLSPPLANAVLGYERYQYGPYLQDWEVGFYDGSLPNGLTRYITAGAGLNVPSLNLGFYFSGMRNSDWGEIRTGGRESYNATTLADTLISVDLSVMRNETWYNVSLPSQIPPRANGELVWVPVADRGVLVGIGGVINPEWAFVELSLDQIQQSQTTSPTFMEQVAVYDVYGENWYTQNTSGDIPPQLTQACSVLVSAQDGSSHNIYLYGGYDGIDSSSNPSDDVYILSLPSFMWTKASSGSSTHGRRAHKCALMYPDQMLVVGGQAQQNTSYNCLGAGLVQVFNLNTLEWQDQYDPNVWSQYKVPDIVTAKIGGSAAGGATTVGPTSWNNNSLSDLFKHKYNGTITTYYPYPSIKSDQGSSGSGTGGSKWLAPVLGVVLGLVGLAAAVILFLVWRRRQYLKTHGTTKNGLNPDASRVWSWLAGAPATKTSAVRDVDDTLFHVSELSSPMRSPIEGPKPLLPDIEPQEVHSEQLYEMADTSAPIELPIISLTKADSPLPPGLRRRSVPNSPAESTSKPASSSSKKPPSVPEERSSTPETPEVIITPPGEEDNWRTSFFFRSRSPVSPLADREPVLQSGQAAEET